MTTDTEDVIAGLELGAYYYITKPYDVEILFAIIRSAIDDRKRLASLKQDVRKREGAMSLIESGTFRLKTLEEASELATLLAVTCPDPDAVASGLLELLINSVEHGNLEIDYSEKRSLLIEDNWSNEIDRRLLSEPYCNRSTLVMFERNDARATFHIKDEGKGFHWQRYIEFDPARAMDPNGRGIAMANNFSFSTIAYQGSGNEVVAEVVFDESS